MTYDEYKQRHPKRVDQVDGGRYVIEFEDGSKGFLDIDDWCITYAHYGREFDNIRLPQPVEINKTMSFIDESERGFEPCTVSTRSRVVDIEFSS